MKNTCKLSLLAVLSIGAASSAQANTSDNSAFFDSSWSAMGFVLGYGSHSAYVRYACGDTDPGVGQECDGPPETGLVRKITGIIEANLAAANYEKCTDIPTTGTKDVVVNGTTFTLNFGTAKNKIPTGWEGGGTTFDRRLEFAGTISGSALKMVVEASCSYEHTALAAINMLVGDHAPGYTRPINIYFGKIGTNDVSQIFLAEKNEAGDVRGAYGFALRIDDTTKTYKIWGSAGVDNPDNNTNELADVYNLTGNYETHAVSIKAKRFVAAGISDGADGRHYDVTSLKAIAGADVATLPDVTDFDMLKTYSSLTVGGTSTAQGCMDFDTPSVNATAATACSGLDWAAAPTPAADADGSFSAAWIFGTMASKLVEIPTL